MLLKISGEAISGEGRHGVDPDALDVLCEELAEATQLGLQIALVVGGGNFLRGADLQSTVERHVGDYMGMLATVMNGLTLESALRQRGVSARALSALEVRNVVPPYTIDGCRRLLEEGCLVILAGGTGNPFFTTDTGASLRAIEIGADELLKGTKVDGVYSGDPNTDPSATRFESVSYAEVLEKRLGVMDATAIALCREHRMPVRVFNMLERGNIRRALLGEQTGTVVSEDA